MFEPTILPTARSTSFFNAATIEVANSGTEVPIARTVTAIILSSIFNNVAISIALETKKSAPYFKSTIPKIKYVKQFK